MTNPETARATNPSDLSGWPSTIQGWYTVAVLTFAYTVSFADRMILTLLVEPVKADLNLSDTEISLLHGFAFALFYSVLGVPMGWLADHYNRKKIIACGATVWCSMTVACGFTSSFLQLFLGRAGVGIGEAALSPAAYSLIQDSFPPEKRPLPASVYTMGAQFGSGLAIILGGAFIALVSSSDVMVIQLLGDLRPWQKVFVLVGGAGFLAVLLLATIKEPKRQSLVSNTKKNDASKLTIKWLFKAPSALRRFFVCHFFGAALLVMYLIGFSSWFPTMVMRRFDVPISEVGLIYGCIVLMFGSGGMFFGGVAAQYLSRKGSRAPELKVITWAIFLLVGLSIATPLMPTSVLAFALAAPTLFLATAPLGIATVVIQNMVSGKIVAQVVAIYLLVMNVIGLGGGSTAVALITDFVFQDDALLHYSLAMCGAVVLPVSLLLFVLAKQCSLKNLN